MEQTPVKYCDPDYGERKSRQGQLCGFTRPGAEVCYKWRVSRSHKSVTKHIAGFAGVLQSDMYQCYVKLAKDEQAIELAACWAHARRKFFEIKDRHPRECALVLKLVGKLYAVEKTIRERRATESDFDDEKAKALRQEKSSNTHARLKRVLTIVRHDKLPAGELASACDYSLNHWDYLSTYLKHGLVDIDYRAAGDSEAENTTAWRTRSGQRQLAKELAVCVTSATPKPESEQRSCTRSSSAANAWTSSLWNT